MFMSDITKKIQEILLNDGLQYQALKEVSIETEDRQYNSDILSLGGNALYDSIGPKQPMKSLKSMRTYQLGVVYGDEFGRETPVFTSSESSIVIPFENSSKEQRTQIYFDNSTTSASFVYSIII